jgi:small subunit ribosomal protein S6
MPEQTPLYDLTLLLSTEAPEEDRAKVLSDVESAISGGGGSIERRNDWGTRPLTYRINHQRDAEYHLLQFTGPPPLLESLSHSLRITDNVLRFRIIKVIPGTPPAPDSAPPVVATAPVPAGAES